MSWDRAFDDPIIISGSRKKLMTLRDAATYITTLSKAEHEVVEWQTAMHVLLQAADQGGSVDFARIGMMQALNRNVKREFNSSRKETHWGKRTSRR